MSRTRAAILKCLTRSLERGVMVRPRELAGGRKLGQSGEKVCSEAKNLILVGRVGIEPTTPGLKVRCSAKLS